MPLRRALLLLMGTVWLALVLVRWQLALQPGPPAVAQEVGSAYLGMLARVALYPPHWLWPGQSGRLLEVVLAGLGGVSPEVRAQRALVEGAWGRSAQARQLWSAVRDTARPGSWPGQLAGYYLDSATPQSLPPDGYFRDQFELDAGRLEAPVMVERAARAAAVLSTLALLAACSVCGSLLALLSLPWWSARWTGGYAHPDPPLEGVLGAFLAWQLLAMLIVPGLVTGLPDPWRLFVAQTLLYTLGILLLRPLLRRGAGFSGPRLALGVVGYWLCLPAAVLAGWLTRLLGVLPQSVNPAMEAVWGCRGWELVVMGLLVALAGPCFEELLFRGAVFRSLRGPLGVRGAMLLSAGLFAVVHADPAMVLPLLALGLIFAWLTERSGSLVPSMIAHSCWNGVTFLLLALSRGG